MPSDNKQPWDVSSLDQTGAYTPNDNSVTENHLSNVVETNNITGNVKYGLGKPTRISIVGNIKYDTDK